MRKTVDELYHYRGTWDRLLFESWTPRVRQLSGTSRLTFGAPEWKHLPEQEVIDLRGAEEVQARPPSAGNESL